MSRISISTFVFLTYLLVACAVLMAITLFAVGAFRSVYYERVVADMAAQAQLTAQAVGDALKSGDYAAVQSYCRKATADNTVRITIMLKDGRVVADSEHAPGNMANHSEREEMRQALSTGKGQAKRFSETLGTSMFYYALPIIQDGQLLGVARISLHLDQIQVVLRLIYSRVLLGAAGVGLIALLMSMAVSWAINRPVQSMVSGVRRFAVGDFTEPLEVPRLAEVADLAQSLNEMAAQLDERLRAVTKERNQQEAVLASMVEGVLAVDNQGRIMTFNQAAIRLTGIDFENNPSDDICVIAPDTPIAGFVSQILSSAQPRESEFGNLSQRGRILQAHGSVLRDARGNGIGAVVVLNDVTRLRRLEQVRRDFVANVSHELRTPITSIKGFVETLLDGALEDPEDARRFLEIVAKQADRLNAILGDLLTLSSIEEGEEKATIGLETLPIRETLEAALQLCAKKASVKNIRINLECEADITAPINSSLLEQAIVNLIDNAIKYSPAGSEIAIRASKADEVEVHVEDHGCGVAAEHLPRIFERFYRVDKARSRSLGGTGLGLSIVKHVITAHGGRVTVNSTPGSGSTFSIFLPA